MVLQAVVDDSGKGGGPVFVLAWFVLSAEQWIGFSDQWEVVLDAAPRIYLAIEGEVDDQPGAAGGCREPRAQAPVMIDGFLEWVRSLSARASLPEFPFSRPAGSKSATHGASPRPTC